VSLTILFIIEFVFLFSDNKNKPLVKTTKVNIVDLSEKSIP
jgi:hypothetical protein